MQAGAISQMCEIFVVLHLISFSSLFYFWPLICNAKFDSNSSCLDRLKFFGINIL